MALAGGGWHNSGMASAIELTVISVPGLNARMLMDHETATFHLHKLGREGSAATVVVLDGASPVQLEHSLFTGLLPEFIAGGRGAPFWQRANVTAVVDAEYALHSGWRTLDKLPQLNWRTQRGLSDDVPAGLRALNETVAATNGPLVVLSAWALSGTLPAPQNAHPLDRPVLLARGFEQTKSCVGILEIAGILHRALTGAVLNDAL